MAIPLRHFLVALGFLLLGGVVGVGLAAGLLPGRAAVAHVHALLAGWVCLTIMGAMTQFVPVWSGTRLYSRRLAAAQLPLFAVGLGGFAAGFLADQPVLVPAFGAVMVLGLWTFAYNLGRTLRSLDAYDVTGRHFALALGFFVALAPLGYLLAADLVHPVFAGLPVSRVAVRRAHATLAVFGAVLTTVLGALYQLATMFTQTELHGVDGPLRRFEELAYPTGVVLLAAGRLSGAAAVATVGGGLVLGGLAAFSVVLARRLSEARVDWTPMLSRYAVAAPALALWTALAVPAWLRNPLRTVFGAPGTAHLLAFGAVGFVVLGTLYHVVPFIVWVHQYSDRLGYEAVPMVDDLYSDRVAAADFWCFLLGGALVTLGEWLPVDPLALLVGGTLLLSGSVLFLSNVLLVVQRHSPHSLAGILLPALASGLAETAPDADGE